MIGLLLGLMLAVSSSSTWARESEQEIRNWLASRSLECVEVVLSNISRPGNAPGSIVAAYPDQAYQYHWERDAARAIMCLNDFYRFVASAEQKEKILPELQQWFEFTESTVDLRGEAKWNLDGSRDSGPWGRPQHDGESLTAIALMDLSFLLKNEQKLYPWRERIQRVLKLELESVVTHWGERTHDVWEEVSGHHFFNRMVQRRALREGIVYFAGDDTSRYSHTVDLIEGSLKDFFFGDEIIPTINLEGRFKGSNLDSVVLLGFIYGLRPGEKFTIRLDDGRQEEISITSPRLARYVERLENVFRAIYPINYDPSIPGVAIGRYPEDTFEGGNPWVLLTEALAQYYILNAIAQPDRREFYLNKARAVIARVRYHITNNEQIDRHNGYPRSVSNLTWTCSELLATKVALEQSGG